jgi:NAD(P)-dependent dehydrogenase (short-subunit alcohol dehydrogenase family)
MSVTKIIDERKVNVSSVLTGKRALVLGGSGGLGRSVSRGLAARGASVIVHGRTESRVNEVVEDIMRNGGDAHACVLDLEKLQPFSTFKDALASACNSMDDKHTAEETPESVIPAEISFPPLDILVAAFGPFVHKSLSEHTVEDWYRTSLFDLALPGALISEVFPGMCTRGFGRILLFGGTRTDVIRGYWSNSAYAAAKTGLGVLTKSIALEGADHNVASILVCPGLADTEYLAPESRRSLAASAPAGRLETPEQIAEIALGLLERNPCIASGAIISLDNGWDPQPVSRTLWKRSEQN